MKSFTRSLPATGLVVIWLIATGPVQAQESAATPNPLQFSTSAPVLRIPEPPPSTVAQLTFGQWDNELVDYYRDRLDKLHNPDRTQEDYARDMLHAGKRAVTEWAKDLEIVSEAGRRIEETVNHSAGRLFKNVKNWFRLDITPPREDEPYGSIYEDRVKNYKLKLNVSTHPSVELRAFHSARLRLYHDQLRAAYSFHLQHDFYAKIGLMFPFESDPVIQPFLRIQREWANGELGLGIRARRHESEDQTDIYGGVFFAMNM